MSSENPRPEHQRWAGARPRVHCHYGVLPLRCLPFACLVLCGSLGICDTNAMAQDERPLTTATGKQAQLTTTSEPSLSIDQSQQGKETAENQENTNKNKKESRGAIVVAPIPISSPAIGSGVVLFGGYIFPFRKADTVRYQPRIRTGLRAPGLRSSVLP